MPSPNIVTISFQSNNQSEPQTQTQKSQALVFEHFSPHAATAHRMAWALLFQTALPLTAALRGRVARSNFMRVLVLGSGVIGTTIAY
ncbi:MAG TPA: hypothetical protein PKE60_17750, partial [Hydrogenophaga sp.]|nr:hypothetical protein [Hydrogenophaga sp.]